jgi:hypothetical protein
MILGFTALNLVSCGGVPSSLKNEFTEKNDAIPPDFGKEETVLLVVLRGRSSYDKYVKSAVEKYYKGAYEYVDSSKESLDTDKYIDTKKYRYFFDYSDGSSYTFNNTTTPMTSTAKRFFVEDRLQNKRYQSGGETGMFGKALKAYMGNLEIKRQSFK